jgi:hypothetical protein
MFCPKCGTQNPENSQFCSQCGEKLSLKPMNSSKFFLINENFLNNLFDRFLRFIRSRCWEKGFACCNSALIRMGVLGCLVLGLVGFIGCCSSRKGFFIGVILLLISVFGSYCGTKLFSSLRKLMNFNPIVLPDPSVIDVLALAFVVGAFSGLMYGFAFDDLATGIVCLVLGLLLALFCAVSTKFFVVKYEPCTYAETLIGIIAFLNNCILFLASIVWGLGIIFVMMLICTNAVGLTHLIFNPFGFARTSLIFGLFPFVIYVAYLCINFFLDLFKSIVILPRKLEKSGK